MQKLKETNIYLMNNGGVIRIPQVFYEDHKMDENKAIEIHRETLPDGRDALIIIPKIQLVNSSQIQIQNN
jgi:hypothetical protein